MSQSSKIIFFGNERLSSGFELHGSPTLQALTAAGYNIAAVVAHNNKATSRKARSLEIQSFAEQHGIKVMLPQKINEIYEDLAAIKPDIGVLVAYGQIVPQAILDLFPKGIINIHPSLLPLYRGPTPIEQAILDCTPKTGVSLMKLVKAMDAGPVFAKAEVRLNGDESKQELTERLLNLGIELVIKNLPNILNGSLKPTYQDDSQATYCKLLTKEAGVLDPSKPAEQLEREVRAFAGWPKSRIKLFGHEVVITKASVGQGGALVVPCANNTALVIDELIAPSGRKMSGADFVRGYKK